MADPAYFSVLTAGVRYDAELSPMEKILFSEITALCGPQGCCFAGNDYFAKLYGRRPGSISRMINRLGKKGFIEIEMKRFAAGGSERRIYPVTGKTRVNNPVDNTSRDHKNVMSEGKNTSRDHKNVMSDLSLYTNIKKNIDHPADDPLALFEKLWKRYPSKLGRTKALKAFKDSVKGEKDRQDIQTALENYLKHLKANTWKHPQQGSTWFNSWREWINHREPEKAAAGSDEKRERLKEELRRAYEMKTRKQGYLDHTDDDDARRPGWIEEITKLQRKISFLEGTLNVA